ncbi:hypothetical protein Acy02nite_62110 [Actinoplanes cyaneus]|uniref:Uncharacterized protein n=1 Tax=Actinoplanes cyaneus TaxID=52696 RepID=A0A919M3I9_9ACTN|nr:hypothetical protein [Actinoplanes cyaneus]MCW2141590.1 hypothetical protein [Actinoplanes cyaneus]GID68330.1 hypothetical protein Acy02nite_62110 [Actinoplanes cyaneus]
MTDMPEREEKLPAAGNAADESETDTDADTGADERLDEISDPPAPLSVLRNRGQVAGSVGQMIQYNYWAQRYRESLELPAEDVQRVMDTFVERDFRRVGIKEPMTSSAAASLLNQQRCLLLVTSADSGGETAAVALLGRTGRQIRKLPVDDDEKRLLPVGELDWPEADEPAAFLVMVPPGAERHGRLPEQLAAYRSEIDRRDARLVMLVEWYTWRAIEGLPGFAAVEVERPNPIALLKELFRDQHERWDVERLLGDQQIIDVLHEASPGQVVRFSWRALAAAEEILALNVADPVPAIVEMAVRAYQNWDKELADWFELHTDVRARLFLISLAFLDGQEAGEVLHYAERLGEELKISGELQGGISGPGIRQLAKAVHARVDDHWRIRFTRAAFGASVLRFVHGDQSAEFVRQMWKWAAALPLHKGAPHQPIANQVAKSMYAIHLSIPRPDIPELRILVHSWWRYVSLRPLVSELITDLALSPEAGPLIRRRLLRWTDASRDSWVLSAVAVVCAGPFADAYPRAAFTRLNRLAIRGIVDDDVVAAAASLWDRPMHRRAVLKQVVEWANEDTPRRVVGLRALASITVTVSGIRAVFEELAADDALRAELVQMFGEIFAPPDGPDQEIRQALKRWLDLAAERQDYRNLMAHLLIHGGRTPGRHGISARYVTMNQLLYEWRPTLHDDEDPRARDFRSWLAEELFNANPLTGPHRPEPRAAA